MISVDRIDSENRYRLVLSPNRSISWPELVVFYLLTCVVALAVGLFFTFQGLWLVLPFSGLEMLLLGCALYLTSRRVYRHEVITLDRGRIRIEKGIRQVEQSWEFETSCTRLIDDKPRNPTGCRILSLGARGEYVVVGEFLNSLEKDELAFQLKDCIIRV